MKKIIKKIKKERDMKIKYTHIDKVKYTDYHFLKKNVFEYY